MSYRRKSRPELDEEGRLLAAEQTDRARRALTSVDSYPEELLAELLGGRPEASAQLDWENRALCKEVDPEIFFPEKGCSTREAKQICGLCPVRSECLEYALDTGQRYGIYGGLSERERRRLRNSPAVDAAA